MPILVDLYPPWVEVVVDAIGRLPPRIWGWGAFINRHAKIWICFAPTNAANRLGLPQSRVYVPRGFCPARAVNIAENMYWDPNIAVQEKIWCWRNRLINYRLFGWFLCRVDFFFIAPWLYQICIMFTMLYDWNTRVVNHFTDTNVINNMTHLCT